MRRLLIANTFSLALAAPALAAEGGDASGFVIQVLNFALLLGALLYFGRKPIAAFFQDRRDAIMAQLSDAADLHREAEEKYARWQRKLVELDNEIDQIRSRAQERAERESTQILADAQAAAERIQRGAAASIEQELRRAQAQLRNETSELAVGLAAGMLREQVTDQDRSRLLDEFIARIEQSPGPRSTHGGTN